MFVLHIYLVSAYTTAFTLCSYRLKISAILRPYLPPIQILLMLSWIPDFHKILF